MYVVCKPNAFIYIHRYVFILLIMNFVCMYDYVYNVYVCLGERAALKL